jgi:hypothetical protein|tara:strand:+ start:361 stop:582 length:222 start_codon:yes stop_codon:yes gene_type:complete
VRQTTKTITSIAVVFWVGAGCQFSRIKSFDLDMGGIEIEYHKPANAEPGFFGSTPIKATPASWPRLMPRNIEK